MSDSAPGEVESVEGSVSVSTGTGTGVVAVSAACAGVSSAAAAAVGTCTDMGSAAGSISIPSSSEEYSIAGFVRALRICLWLRRIMPEGVWIVHDRGAGLSAIHPRTQGLCLLAGFGFT